MLTSIQTLLLASIHMKIDQSRKAGTPITYGADFQVKIAKKKSSTTPSEPDSGNELCTGDLC